MYIHVYVYLYLYLPKSQLRLVSGVSLRSPNWFPRRSCASAEFYCDSGCIIYDL